MISLIVAVAENGVIGKDNTLIWKLSDDLKNFKLLTSGHSVIMGRKTYESIGRPLPNRTNIVVSRSKDLEIEGCVVVNSLKKAYETAAESPGAEECFVIGGAQLYAEAFSDVDKIYLTFVKAKPDGDAFFDIKKVDNWHIQSLTEYTKNEKNEYDFSIKVLTKP